MSSWLVVALLWVAAFSNFLVRLLPTSMHGSVVGAMPMNEAQFGLLTAALFWTYALTTTFGGLLADRFSRSRVILITMFLWSATTWLTSFARNFEQFFLLRALTGLSEACYFPAATALICDYHTGPTRSLAIGIHQSGVMIGLALSGVGGWLAERTSWHYTFAVVGLGSLAYSAVLLFLLRDAPAADRGRAEPAARREPIRIGEALPSLLSSPGFLLVCATAGLQSAIGWPVLSWTPLYLQEHFNLTQGQAGILSAGCINAACVPGLVIGGIWSDRWSRRHGRGRMWVAAIGLLAAAPGILLTAASHTLALTVLGLVLYSLFVAFFPGNIMPILCEVVDRRYRATSYGLMNLFASTAGGLGIFFPGVMRDLKMDLRAVYGLVAAGLVICAALIASVRPGAAGFSHPASPATLRRRSRSIDR